MRRAIRGLYESVLDKAKLVAAAQINKPFSTMSTSPHMNCSREEALALLSKWKDGASVFVLLTGTVGPLDDSFVGIKFSSLARVEGFDKDGLLLTWPNKGRFFLVFNGASFVYSDPSRDIPPEMWEHAGAKLVGGLQILLPFGLTCVICEVSDS